MDDKSLGYTIMGVTIIVMLVYLIWLFPGVFGTMFAWLEPYSEWAIRLPVIAAVYMILFIVLWIGYTMATTPPPVPLDTPLDLDSELDDDLDVEEDEKKDEE
jgi:predicted DNA-binding transcriptional regulator